METTLFTPPAYLTKCLTAYADAQQAVTVITEQQQELATTASVVEAYLNLGKAATAARKAKSKAYAALVAASLNAFDGETAQLHEVIRIDQHSDAQIGDHAAALLWLLCNAASSIDLANSDGMATAVKQVAKTTPLMLRRSLAHAAVEELFEQPTITVSGWIEITATGERRWQQYPIAPCSNVSDAQRQAERCVNVVVSGKSWQWVEPPSFEQSVTKRDHIVFAEPVTVPKPKIKRDLSAYVTPQEHPHEHQP